MEIDLTARAESAEKCECQGTCSDDCGCSCHDKKEASLTQEDLVAFSVEIVKILEKKTEEHNEAYPKNKVSIEGLKELFMQGVRAENLNDLPLVELGLARVNSFLKLKSGDYSARETGYEFSLTPPRDALNVYAYRLPNEEDFSQAKEDVTSSGLNVLEVKFAEDFFIETETKDQKKEYWIEC